VVEIRRHKADVNGVRLHYVTAGRGDPVLLVHGFPQTWHEWRHLIGPLAERFTVIAPDYRGAGHSSRPPGGYDKRTMATDLRELVRHLGLDRVSIIGHDIGLMVAYAYAARFPDATSKLVVIDAPLPGTTVWDRVSADPRVWHFVFQGVRDLPEVLVAGREREYVTFFINARIYNTAAFTPEDVDLYVRAYTEPGAMRAGFELYRAFGQDIGDNRELMRNRLTMPVLAVGAEHSTSGPLVPEMMREVADDVTGVLISDSAHWMPEENADALLKALTDFL
jgi:pimeloyl-ACP methyl ester carboxylesterase